jgi:hypothetical protein
MKTPRAVSRPVSRPATVSAPALLVPLLCLGLACATRAATGTFDFDTGTPTLTTGQGLPLTQTSGGITASFRASSGSFSVQSDASTGFTLSQFSGKYLYPNGIGDVLEIQFSQTLTNLTFAFATADFPPIETPTPILLTAYTNSASTSPVGTVTAQAAYGSSTLPMGTLTFDSAIPFNLVRINIQPGGGTGFLMDNLAVHSTEILRYTIATSASPGTGGTTSGGGTYASGASVTVVATPNPGYAFVNWTENGTPVSTAASYTFTASANRSLVANFTLPTLQSAATVDGLYQDDASAILDAALQTITATATLPHAFYRLSSTTSLKFLEVRLTGNQVFFRYGTP